MSQDWMSVHVLLNGTPKERKKEERRGSSNACFDRRRACCFRAGKCRNIMTWTVFSTYLIMTRSLIMTRYHDTAPDQCIRPIGINPWPWEKMSWLSVFSIFVYYFNTPYHDSGSFSPNLSWVNLYEFSCQAAALCLGQPASLPDIRPASLPGIRPARRGR